MSSSNFPTAFVRPNLASIKIVSLIVTQTGTYNQMYLRPYTSHFDNNIANELNTRLETNLINGTWVGTATSGLMAGIANKIIMPSAQPEHAIPIVNGWTEKRGRFSMIVEIGYETGTVQQYHIQGYTNHYDLSINGQIDPNTEFYINSFVKISQQYISTPTGLRSVEHATDIAQVINGRLIHNQTNSNIFGMRPNELYSVMQSDDIYSNLYNYDERINFTDGRYNFSDKTVKSTRNNNVPSSMLSRIIESYQTAQSLREYGSDNANIYTKSKAYVYEEDLIGNPFFRRLSDVTGIPNAVSFTLLQLQRIDGNVLNNARFVRLNDHALRKVNTAGSSEYWHNPNDIGAWVSTVLVNCVPTIMLDLMLTNISFSATNHDSTGRNTVIITGARDLFGRSLNENFNIFKHRFVNEIMHDITHGNQELYNLNMSVDMFGDTVIDISLGSLPMTRYVAPSFCDSLMSPVVTMNENNLRETASDINNILMSIQHGNRTPTINEGI